MGQEGVSGGGGGGGYILTILEMRQKQGLSRELQIVQQGQERA